MRGEEQGFGLLEVIFALALIGLSLLPLISLMLDNNQQIKRTRQLTKAVNLARWQLEVQRGKDFSQLMDKPIKKIPGSDYSYLVDSKQIAAKLKRIMVQVKYKGKIKAKLVTIVNGTAK